MYLSGVNPYPRAMNNALDTRALARQPQQQRGFDRFEQVLNEAEALIMEAGIEGFSIPALAERLDFTRTSIYKFFPTPYAILNTLAERHLGALEAALAEQAEHLRAAKNWREVISLVVRGAARYYHEHPMAYRLLLSGPISDSSYRALEYTISRLGGLTRAILAERGVKVPSGQPDVAALAVEFGTASFRMSYFLHGTITPAYTQAAVDVMLAFLAARLDLK